MEVLIVGFLAVIVHEIAQLVHLAVSTNGPKQGGIPANRIAIPSSFLH